MKWVHAVSNAHGLVSLLGSESLRWIARFDRLALRAGERYEEPAGDRETGIVVLLGRQTFSVGGALFENVGGRDSLWRGRPTVLYVPPGQSWKTEAISNSEIILCGAPAAPGRAAGAFIRTSDDIEEVVVGRGNWKRIVRFLLGGKDETQHLFLGECINPPGNWSGTPPHRHMGIAANESLHEEAYYFRCSDPQGWGIERTWWTEEDIDIPKVVGDGTATVIPYGYHQVVAAPGYWLDYVFCMSGPVARPSPVVSPDHGWLADESQSRPSFEPLVQLLGL